MYKLCIYIPEPFLEDVKQALFDAGAGCYKQYSQCCWQVLGIGQFKAEQGSQPYIGKIAQLETVAEYRVEMLVSDNKIQAVYRALHAVHPYEEPAYDFTKILNINNISTP